MADILAIRRLKDRDMDAAAGLLTEYWKEREVAASKRAARSFIEEGHVSATVYEETFLAELDGKPIGVLGLAVSEGGLAKIRTFFMHPAHRGKGNGEAFLSFMLALIEQSKVRKVTVHAFPETKQLYARLGFQQEGLLKDHYRKGEHVVLMSRFFDQKQRKIGSYANR